MIYMLNTNIPDSKTVAIALTSITGIGLKHATLICSKIGIGSRLRIRDLEQNQITQIKRVIEKYYLITNDLSKEVSQDISKLLMIKCFRGFRHFNQLPVRGQRSHSNARTQKKIRRYSAKQVSAKKLVTKNSSFKN